MKRLLRHGYTTGACAAAAAKGAALLLRDQRPVDEVEIVLPRGEPATFHLQGQEFAAERAACFVVKDAGDDPDVTNGAEIHAAVTLTSAPSPGEREPVVVIEGGEGIGRVTKPGLAVPPGEWAINPVPRRMITDALHEVFPNPQFPITIHCLLCIPNGAALARKTLNARLGIIGGLSILGTTGIVKPISAKAWTDTLDAALDVAVACGCTSVVLSTGRSSELVAQKYLGTGDWGLGTGKGLQEEAFVMMGDHVAYALQACARRGVRTVVLAGQFAKLLKVACGHGQTHVAASSLELESLVRWVESEMQDQELASIVREANTARQVLEESGNAAPLAALVGRRARDTARQLAPAVEVKVLVAGYRGEVLYFR